MKITEANILSAYNYLKKNAETFFEKGAIQLSLEYAEACAKLAYHSNIFYVDNELEELLHDIGNSISKGIKKDINSIKHKYAFIDTNGSDNHGLTQQYIRALMDANVEFLYIYEDGDLSRIKIILQEIRAYPLATVLTFENKYTYEEKTRAILNALAAYGPEKFLMHIMPWDVVAIMVCSVIKGVTRYNINATDHAFWLGASCIDYCIEFRNYGYTVSAEKRGLAEGQLLLLPFYPVVNRTQFNGFPVHLPENKVKIFSGGSFYKICGEGGIFLKILKQLLDENDNAIILLAGIDKNLKLDEFICKHNFQQRILLIGNRSDIAEVVEQCDIFLGTYPILGGLMSQYAAVAGKPILAYANPQLAISFIEGVVCHQMNFKITHTDLPSFFEYGRRLCNDVNFRISEGQKLIGCVISARDFGEEMKYILANNKSKRSPMLENINYTRLAKLYLEVENDYLPGIRYLLTNRLRYRLVYKFPVISLSILILAFNKFLRKCLKKW